MSRNGLALACLLGLIAGGGMREATAAPRADQASVDAAAKKGAEWLLQKAQGGLPDFPHANQSIHSNTTWRDFVLYAMMHGGIDPNDPAMVNLINASLSDKCHHTYQAVVRLQALHQYSKIRKLKFSSRYFQTGQFLVDNQGKNGIWGYSEPSPLAAPNIVVTPSRQTESGGRGPVVRPWGSARSGTNASTKARSGMTQPRTRLQRRGWGNPNDLSNTQYALLGLWICMNEGIWPPTDCLPLLEQYLTDAQKDDGGWGYKKNDGSTGSMTAGGVFCLGACLRAKGNTNPMSDPRVQKAVGWLAGHLDFSKNPGKGGKLFNGWQYYWIYSVERTGAILDTEQFGNRRWYDEGVQYLLSAQKGDGSWGDIFNTGYAILFLKQATRQLVTYSGDHAAPKVFQPDPQKK